MTQLFDPVVLSEKGITEVVKARDTVRKLQSRGRVSHTQLTWWEDFVRDNTRLDMEPGYFPVLQLKDYLPRTREPNAVDPNLEKAVLAKMDKDTRPAKVSGP